MYAHRGPAASSLPQGFPSLKFVDTPAFSARAVQSAPGSHRDLLYPKPLPSLNFSDPSDLLRSLTIGSDPSDPFRSLRSLRSLRSIPIPLIRVISSTHTLPISVLSLPSHASHCEDKFHQRRALGDARRNLYSRERALILWNNISIFRALGNLKLKFDISNL